MQISRSALLSCACLLAWIAAPCSSAAETANPFARFIGEWTLKNDDWTQNWGNGLQSIKIPNHHTLSQAVNTNNSLLSVVDTPPKGHIFWTWNPVTKEVRHLSSFGDIRMGVGQGTLNEKGDLKLKVSFEGEAAGTYRIYTYVWISDDEYELKSTQFDANDKPTGLFYSGRFVRLKTKSPG